MTKPPKHPVHAITKLTLWAAVDGWLVFQVAAVVFAGTDVEANRKSFGLTFYASFDQTADADFAMGAPSAIYGCQAEFEPGRVGPAIHLKGLGPNRTFQYLAERNLEIAQGTVAFWYQPDWSADQVHRTILASDKDWVQPGMLLITWWFDGPRHGWGFYGSGANRNPQDLFGCLHAANQETTAQAGEWRHLAITWADGQKPQLFVNGGNRTIPGGPTDYRWTPDRSVRNNRFFLGSRFSGEAVAEGCFDELMIFGKALSDAEIRAIYEAKVPFK